MDMRKPRVPVMSDPTQKAVALLVLNPLTRSLMTSLPLPTKKTTETRRKELTASCTKTMECGERESTVVNEGRRIMGINVLVVFDDKVRGRKPDFDFGRMESLCCW